MKENLFNKNFTIMIVGQFISLFGNALQRFALSLYILDLTGSAAMFSIILSVAILPQILLSPFGGAIADRFSKKKIMVILDTLSGALLFLFALLLGGQSDSTLLPNGQGNGTLIMIGALMCIMAVIQSIYDPAVRASLPIMVAPEKLGQANSVVSIVSAVTSLLGPVAAGFLYGFFGIQAIFVINIISFLASAFMELFLYIEHQKSDFTGGMFATFCGDIKGTASYLVHEKKSIFYIILLSGALNLFLSPIYSVGVPYIEKIVFGVSDQLYGISEGCVGLGMIVGAMLVGPLSKMFPIGKMHYYFNVLTLLILAMGATTLPGILAQSGVSFLSYVLFTCIGFVFVICLANVNISFMAYLQLETPNELMGKTMALTGSLSMALMPIGQIIFGGLYEAFDGQLMMIYILVALLNIATTIILKKILRTLPAPTFQEEVLFD